MLKIKNILVITVSGFIFSFLTGLFSGNPLWIILQRSLIGTFILTIVVVAAFIVLKKTLPEFGDAESINDSEKKVGRNLDIVIDDENILESENDEHSEDTLFQKGFIEEVEEDAIDDIDDIEVLNNMDDSEEVIEVMDDQFDSNTLPELDENISFLSGSSGNTVSSGNDAMDKLGLNADSETMAKAIKTILKKDQEG